MKSLFNSLLALLISASAFSVPLSGTYTINSALPTTGTNYGSFTLASADLTLNGVSGAVTFLVKQGTYNEQVVIGSISGTSVSNTVTFKADPLNSAVAKIEYNGATSSTDNYVIRFSGANYIIVDSLEISSTTGSSYGKLVDFLNFNSHITFKNNTLYGSRNLSSSDDFSIFYDNSGATNVSGDLTFDNNKIYGGSNAFYINSSGSAHQSNFFITNNTVMYSSDYGVYTNESSNVQVIGNYFEDDSNRNTTLHSIYLTYSDSASDIRENNIRINSGLAHAYGIRVTYVYGSASNPVHIENNMVNMVGLATNKLQYGLNVANAYYQNIYHNTIKVNSSWTTYGRPLYMSGATGVNRGKVNIVNNIFYNNQGTYALHTTSVASVYIDSLNHNVYYSSGGTSFKYNNTDYSSLAAMQLASGKDGNSLFGDPGFTSATDLHLIGTIADNTGDNTIGVTTDIDGDVRPFLGSTSVDIGADEYSLIACPPPSVISSVEIRHDSARITWLNGPNDVSWIVEYGITGFTPGTGVVINSTADTVAFSALLATTCYDVYLRSICTIDSSALVGPFVFCTPCAPIGIPYLQDFTTMTTTGPPTCWLEGKGFLGASTKVTEGYSAWTSDDFGNVGSLNTGAARCELGYTNINDWLVSPLIDLGTGSGTSYQVEFKIAVTEGNGPNAPIGGTIALDDKVVFLISTDYGTTWSDANILRQWDTTDIPVAGGEFFSYDLTAGGYSGVVRFAFYTQSTINNYRTEVHIDDFKVDAVPVCPDPSGLMATANTTTSVSLAWTNGANDISWLLEYGTVGFLPGSGTTIAGASGSGTIPGLTSSSLYDVYLRSVCAVGDTSRLLGPLKIQTACAAQSDFCEDFEASVDSSILPVCWRVYNNSTVLNAVVQVDASTQAYSGSSYLLMNNMSDLTSTFILASPEVSNLSAGTHRANFWAKESGSGGTSKLIIGTMANPSMPGTFIGRDTISLATIYTNYKIDFTSYTGTDDHVAFLWQQSTTNDRVFIDEFCWEVIPSCEKPLSASILNSGVDSTRLDIGWSNDTSHASYLIWYGPAGYTPGATNRIGTLSTTTNYNPINSLTPLTEYCFWVKAMCNGGDSSAWEGPLCGRTGCPDAFPIPYSENYSTYLPDCWEEKQGRLGVTNTTFSSATTSGWESRPFANSGINLGANIQIFGTSRDEWLISPSIDFGTDPNVYKFVEFDAALTESSNTNQGAFGADDSLVLVISLDNGITWKQSDILIQFDTSNFPTATGSNYGYAMTNTTGKVKFGFYAASSLSNNTMRFHVDNFKVKDTVFDGINEIAFTNQFQVYPNPNDGIFTLYNKGESKKYQVLITDVQGRIVYEENQFFNSNARKNIDISRYNSGVYILQLVNENKIEQHRLIIR
ncbi:MAG: T9SS type A sorting domain-containing protein [Flavobacteriales bacterium]